MTKIEVQLMWIVEDIFYEYDNNTIDFIKKNSRNNSHRRHLNQNGRNIGPK